ncbi:ATP-binding protein [Streptomyces sp. NPDC056656]|uniref:ATP-binding protein n=1 Tax=Streptomyces sp. NPDC056656 TaxID=3345895 RepID=UPI0036C30BD2
MDLPTGPHAPSQARAHTADTLSRWTIPGEIIDDLTLITSELATNSVQHTVSSTITVTVALTPAEAVVTVTDQGLHARFEPASSSGPYAERGRGLVIVQALATRWTRTPLADGTEVLAAIALPEHTRGEAETDAARTHR